jgi:MoaA/NifB/PqqE/SkfB family radical SAM enzyme
LSPEEIREVFEIPENQIEVCVIELTNKCDLNCVFCTRPRKNDSIDIKLLKKLLKENNRLINPIKNFELGWNGNPLLNRRIEEILKMFQLYQLNLNIVTNGFNLKDTISFFEDDLLKNVHFTIFFDSANEEKNDFLMGTKKAFKKTIESIEYLLERNLKYDFLMRVNSKNYDEIKDVLEIAKFYHSNLLIPMEIFPFTNKKNLLLTDEMKSKVIETIDKLKSIGEPIHKNIQFEQPFGNCTYLRNKRLFVNSKGELSFCHFISILKNAKMSDNKNEKIEKLISINNEARDIFVANKSKELIKWKLPRKNASPCSYCLYHFGVRENW